MMVMALSFYLLLKGGKDNGSRDPRREFKNFCLHIFVFLCFNFFLNWKTLIENFLSLRRELNSLKLTAGRQDNKFQLNVYYSQTYNRYLQVRLRKYVVIKVFPSLCNLISVSLTVVVAVVRISACYCNTTQNRKRTNLSGSDCG